MVKSLTQAGNFNLKGKKQMRCNCPCCLVRNLKEREEDKRIKKEINQFKVQGVK